MAQPTLPPDKTFRMVVKLVSTDGNELPFKGFVLIPEDRLIVFEGIAVAARDLLATQNTGKDEGQVAFDMDKLMSDSAAVEAAQTLALKLSDGDLSHPAALEAAHKLALKLSDGNTVHSTLSAAAVKALGDWVSELEKVWDIPQTAPKVP
jgi:hypothetical protein